MARFLREVKIVNEDGTSSLPSLHWSALQFAEYCFHVSVRLFAFKV